METALFKPSAVAWKVYPEPTLLIRSPEKEATPEEAFREVVPEIDPLPALVPNWIVMKFEAVVTRLLLESTIPTANPDKTFPPVPPAG